MHSKNELDGRRSYRGSLKADMLSCPAGTAKALEESKGYSEKTEQEMKRLMNEGGIKRCVLIVDDELINREILGAMLSDTY